MKPHRLRTLSWLLAAVLLLGCAITATPTPAPQSLPPQDLGTIVAGTAIVAQTRTAARITPSPTSTSTRTPSPTPTPATPTPTFFFSLATKTPTPSATLNVETAAAGGGSDGDDTSSRDRGKGGFTGLEWSCGIAEKTYRVVRPKEEFSLYVTFRNTGTKSWGNNAVDLVYTGGYRHIGTKIVDMPVSIAPGNTVTFRVDFEAPKASGSRNSFFSLKVGSNTFCGVRLSFEVIGK